MSISNICKQIKIIFNREEYKSFDVSKMSEEQQRELDDLAKLEEEVN
jgi:hypothetical protein